MQIAFNNSDDLVNNFVKSTKVSKTKLLDFIEQLKANAVKVKPVRVSTGPVGKKVTEDSLKVRQWLEENGHTLIGRKMTNKEFATIVGVDPVTAANNVNWVMKNKKTIQLAGHAEKADGQRGRPAILWEVIGTKEQAE